MNIFEHGSVRYSEDERTFWFVNEEGETISSVFSTKTGKVETMMEADLSSVPESPEEGEVTIP